MAINRKILALATVVPAFSMSACVTVNTTESGCLVYQVPQDCYNAVDIQNFLSMGYLTTSNLGNGSLDRILIAEYGLVEMTDQQVVEDFRSRYIAETPDGARKFNLAGRILDARENGNELRLRGADLEILGITGQTVLVIQPDDLDTFIQNNQEAIDNLSGAREPARAPAVSF